MPRRIVAHLFMTIDGVVEAPEKWSTAYWNDDIQKSMQGGMFDADTLLLGRRTYETFAESWSVRSAGEDPGADHMNSVRKYVASRTLTELTWNNSELLGGDLATAITELKATEGSDIPTSGSPTLVRWLMEQGLLDELNLLVYPEVRGAGLQLFTGIAAPLSLEAVTTEAFDNGVLHLRYRPKVSAS